MSVVPNQASSLGSWLNYLEHKHPVRIELGLERVKRVADRLGCCQSLPFVITVAGTNGKGTTIAFLEQALRRAGLKVGSYTSPHLLKYNERIKINAEQASDEMICSAFFLIEQASKDISLSYFEVGTLAALLLFKQYHLDILLLEVGLGGRLDAVNIVDANIAIITSIDLDHMEYLGETREAIAEEKAGIIRANCPVICGDPSPPQSLLDVAQKNRASLYQINTHYRIQCAEDSWSWLSEEHVFDNCPWPELPIENVATAMMALCLLEKNNISNYKMNQSELFNEQGLIKTVSLAGRYQIIHTKPITILDVAHNPHAARYLAHRLTRSVPELTIHAVFTSKFGKDLTGILQPFLHLVKMWHLAPMALESMVLPEDIAGILSSHSSLYRIYPSVENAYKRALLEAGEYGCVVVFGSFHTVEKVLSLYTIEKLMV